MENKKVLVVDDELHIQELIKYNIEQNGFKVVTADTGERALEIIENDNIDIILLDLMLPGIDGLEVCKQVKMNKKTKKIPIIMLTAKSDEFDKVLGLELGADDYLTKPFSVRELTARVKAVLRRLSPEGIVEEQENIKFGDILINKNTHEIYKNGQELEMALKEYEILLILAQNKGKVVSREFLLNEVWGYEYFGETRTVDVHIRHIRQKIEDESGSKQFIETVRGVGYKLIVKGE